MSNQSNRSRFTDVDWDDIETNNRRLSPERATFVAGCVLLALLFLYDTYVAHVYLVGTYQVHPVDWVFFLGLIVLISYGVIPLAQNAHAPRQVFAYLFSRPAYTFATVFFSLVVVLGIIGPFVFGTPRLRFEHRFHAPYGFSSEMGWTVECLGEVTQGEGITRHCAGSPTYPLGTNHRGHGMIHLAIVGARVALYVAVFTLAFVVPLATAVGIIAGFRGGLVDDLLMGYVDMQLSVPAILIYFIGYIYWNPSLLLLLVTFGLFSWGGIARLVRSEVLQRREEGFVLVTRSFGASERYVAWRHVVPNITNTLVPAVFHLLALLILVEAGVAFLGFHEEALYSWGSTIAEGLDVNHHTVGFTMYPHQVWWVATVPALVLSLTLLSLKLLGDGIRDALDPHRHH